MEERTMQSGGRTCSSWLCVKGVRHKQHGVGPTGGSGRAGEKCTWNIRYMFVTLEVSQLDMSASKFSNSLKSPLMSVMAETSQSAMSLKAAGLALNAWTAAFREAVLVKVPGGEGGGSHALPVASRWKPASHSQSQPRT